MSSPAGAQTSPGRSTTKIVFSGSVWKYSPSSTCVLHLRSSKWFQSHRQFNICERKMKNIQKIMNDEDSR